MATSPASAGASSAAGSVMTIATESMAGSSHVLMTVQGYSKLKEALDDEGSVKSDTFRAGGHSWYIEHDPRIGYEDDRVIVYLCLDDDDGQVTTRYELSLLNRDGDIISSAQNFHTFHGADDYHIDIEVLNASHLLGDSFQIRCVLDVVDEITAVRPPDLHQHLGGLLTSQIGDDVTFQVGGELFTAHKYILAARSPVFLDELFGTPAPGKDNSATTTNQIRIDSIEPRVFRALLHFVYTDTLPEVNGEGGGDVNEKVAMAQGLLVAADKYGMERLKVICGDILCNHIDARTAIALLQLADSHGCRRLKEACIRVIKDLLTKVAAP
ncbi:unnamed protein product [Urochloa humidicola]